MNRRKLLALTVVVFALLVLCGYPSLGARVTGLPLSIAEAAPATRGQFYAVAPGDSLWLIANAYNTTVEEILTFNQLPNPDLIYPGEVLWIPGFTYDDLGLLSRLVQAESEGEPYAGQVAVASVVLNRIEDWRFPGSVAGVIYDPYQFQVVTNGRLYAVSGNDLTAWQAAQDAIKGWDPSYGALFFYNPMKASSWWIRTRPVTTVIGNHVFAR